MVLKRAESHLRSSPFWDVTQRRLVVSDVLGHLSSYICNGQGVFLDCLILEDGTDRFSQHVGNYHSTLSNIPEERRSHLYRGASLKWRITHIETGPVPVLRRNWRGTQPPHCDPTETGNFSVDKKNQLNVTFCILYFSSNSCSTCFG